MVHSSCNKEKGFLQPCETIKDSNQVNRECKETLKMVVRGLNTNNNVVSVLKVDINVSMQMLIKIFEELQRNKEIHLNNIELERFSPNH